MLVGLSSPFTGTLYASCLPLWEVAFPTSFLKLKGFWVCRRHCIALGVEVEESSTCIGSRYSFYYSVCILFGLENTTKTYDSWKGGIAANLRGTGRNMREWTTRSKHTIEMKREAT